VVVGRIVDGVEYAAEHDCRNAGPPTLVHARRRIAISATRCRFSVRLLVPRTTCERLGSLGLETQLVLQPRKRHRVRTREGGKRRAPSPLRLADTAPLGGAKHRRGCELMGATGLSHESMTAQYARTFDVMPFFERVPNYRRDANRHGQGPGTCVSAPRGKGPSS